MNIRAFNISTQPTLWDELLAYFKAKYFPRSVGAYENLGISPDDSFPIWCIIAAIALGMIFASALMVLYKKIYGAFVEKMIAEGALGEENARTLAELGYENNFLIRRALKNGRFYSVIKSAENDRFYIPEDKKYAAEVRFDTKGASWRSVVLVCIVAVVGYFVIMAFLPQILTFLDGVIGSIK